MELDPSVPKYQNSDPTSFAYTSARERWPSIITGVIDDLHRSVASLSQQDESSAAKLAEGKQIVADIAAVKYQLQHNRQLVPLPNDGKPDIKLYNEELEQRGYPKWHEVEWLYSECYLYRWLSTFFTRSTHWKSYDPFRRQKISTFKSSRPAVLELAQKYREIISNLRSSNQVLDIDDPKKVAEAEKVLFTEMAEICLWGNATDLSLLTSLTYEDIQKLQGSNARKESEKNILVNDLDQVFSVLNKAKAEKKSTRRVDIVLDNAGFELFVDLVLAGYLLATGLATEVVLHPKNVPWFVSDVVPADFQQLLSAMSDPRSFYEKPDDDGKEMKALSAEEVKNIQYLFEHWSELHGEGQLILRTNGFWTHAGGFWRLPKLAPELYEDLKGSEVIIFKGDLNYRKLVGDGAWDPTTAFVEAIGPLGKSSDLRVLALRTCKADTVVGLPKGRDEELRATPNGGGDSGQRKWGWSGKYAVVQFSDGKA